MEATKEKLKKLFDSMKKIGYFKEYKSYEDWSKKNGGEVEPEQKKLIEETLEKESEKSLEEFKKEMPQEEREEFEKIF